MKRFGAFGASLGLLAGGIAAWSQPEIHVLVLMGDSEGYLSPCGCTKPMTGGIRRRATAVRALTAGKEATILEAGGLIKGNGRQDHLKAEALGEALRAMGAHAVAFTENEARLGQGLLESLRNLAGDVFFQSNLQESATNPLPRFRLQGPFLVGAVSERHAQLAGALGETSVSNEVAAGELVEEAAAGGKAPILLLAGGREEAERMARGVPGLRLIQYRSASRPSPGPLRVGKTLLVSPGEKGKHVLRLEFVNGEFGAYQPIELTPDFRDDATVSRVYRRYLARVDEENLLAKMPRAPAAKFAGTAKCGSCHAKEMAVWKASEHAKAQRTLINEGHGRDPDCVGCHVVGLTTTTGFRSVQETPQLANVGCESCHGPGEKHSKQPKFQMGKVGSKMCVSCHDPANSPNFEFGPYWKRIAH